MFFSSPSPKMVPRWGLSKPQVTGIEVVLEPCPEIPQMDDLHVLIEHYMNVLSDCAVGPQSWNLGLLGSRVFPTLVPGKHLDSPWHCGPVWGSASPSSSSDLGISTSAYAVGSLCSCLHSWPSWILHPGTFHVSNWLNTVISFCITSMVHGTQECVASWRRSRGCDFHPFTWPLTQPPIICPVE